MFRAKHSKIGSKSVGAIGEDLACIFLKKNGFRILFRNAKMKLGEIDVIAERGGCVSFVEVKTLLGNSLLMPEDNVSSSKKGKMRRAAQEWIAKNEHSFFKNKIFPEWRIDVVAIRMQSTDGELTNIYKDCEIEFYENAA